MTTYTFPPTILPSRFRMRLIANTQSGGRSPFDGTEQTLELPGARWAADLTFEGLPAEEHRPFLAFLTKLRGRAGRFTWEVPMPRIGLAGGTPVIRQAGLTGRIVRSSGWGAGVAVAPGDWISWVDPTGRWAMHQVTGDASDAPEAVSSASGIADFTVTPPIRRSPANGATIYPGFGIGVFRLAEDDTGLDIVRGLMGGGTLRIEEAIW